jgi:hypothetical protein
VDVTEPCTRRRDAEGGDNRKLASMASDAPGEVVSVKLEHRSRDYRNGIAEKLNDPQDVLPSPFI